MKRLLFFPQTLSFTILFLLAVFCLTTSASAQEDQEPKDAAPPPLKVLSKAEKSQLEDETNIKKRTQLSLEFMETRLKSAETFVSENKFQDSINELGGFQALLENTLNYLERNDRNGSNKTDYNFKRLEIGLRRTVSRLELIRRDLPFKYGFYVQKLQKFVRDARARAVEPLFSDSVIPGGRP